MILMVPPVVEAAQATCHTDTPRHLQLICSRADAVLFIKRYTSVFFKQHSVSTINSGLVFNGKASQVIQGVSWIKMHPYLKQSHIYKTCKQQQCVSDI